MPYLSSHHGSFWFQIRVPAALITLHGRSIRQNLQTTERAVAQQMAYQLASYWLGRFSADRAGVSAPQTVLGPSVVTYPPSAVMAPQPVLAPLADVPVPAPEHNLPETPQPKSKASRNQSPDSIDDALKYWKTLHPHCSPSTYREFQSISKEFKKHTRKRPSEQTRADIVSYRDRLLSAGAARATIAKKISVIGTMLQTLVDGSVLQFNVARGIKIPKPKVEPVI